MTHDNANKSRRETLARDVLFRVLDCEHKLGRAESSLRRQHRRFPEGHEYVDSAKRGLEAAEIAASEAWATAIRYGMEFGILGGRQ